jgi:hypothetical protein
MRRMSERGISENEWERGLAGAHCCFSPLAQHLMLQNI